LFQRLDGRDIRIRRARANDDTGPDAAEHEASLHGNLAILRLFIECGGRGDHNVRDLTLGHSLGELRRRIELYLNLVAACAFELFCRR